MKIKKIFPMLMAGIFAMSMLGCGANPEVLLPTEMSGSVSTPTTGAPVGNASGACANPYLPVIVGATWNYKLTGPLADTFTRSIISLEADSFTDQDIFSKGVTRQSKWNCENGNLTALDPSSGASSSINTENLSLNFQTTELSGVTLPAVINPGDTWSQTATLEGTQVMNGAEIPAKNQFTANCTAIGVETITVEAGTFDAMRFDCPITMNISITMQDNPIQTSLEINSTHWYAQSIGMIKTVSTGDGLNSTIELVSFTIPISQ